MTEAPAKGAPGHRRHLSGRLIAAGAAGVLVAGVVLGLAAVLDRPGIVSTDDATVEADITPINTRVAGAVRDAPVGDFETVKAGQVLVQLDDRDAAAQAAKTAADVKAAEAQLVNLQSQRALLLANVSGARAGFAATAATLDRNEREATRQGRLIADGVGSEQQREAADAAARQSRAQLAQNRAQIDAATAQEGILAAQDRQAAASLAAANAALDLARLNVGYARITAPNDGVVGQRLVRQGQYLNVGGQVFSLAAAKRWVLANFKETQLTRIARGQPATVTVDAFPGRRLRGHVEAFAPATGAKFALIPPDNATGNFTKVAQRLGVKIALDNLDGLDGRLRAGLSVTARVDIRAPPPPETRR